MISAIYHHSFLKKMYKNNVLPDVRKKWYNLFVQDRYTVSI
uniref:Uncharacterized protein n=1 Tax=Siphoviridae sp. ctuvi3 TaxID=2825718 RepID=A0A8S5TZQ0_9CAUD|nr:MAG TPA: hypothetical protein [Siphoviridae sp. ctuvi3]